VAGVENKCFRHSFGIMSEDSVRLVVQDNVLWGDPEDWYSVTFVAVDSVGKLLFIDLGELMFPRRGWCLQDTIERTWAIWCVTIGRAEVPLYESLTFGALADIYTQIHVLRRPWQEIAKEEVNGVFFSDEQFSSVKHRVRCLQMPYARRSTGVVQNLRLFLEILQGISNCLFVGVLETAEEGRHRQPEVTTWSIEERMLDGHAI
jgi:hypothetical protein